MKAPASAARPARLEAPHRRLGSRPRLFEKLVVRAFRAASWVFAHVPARPAAALVGLGAQLSYLAWPTKRRWVNANFGHILGLRPDHPRVRRLALRTYARYGRYLVEVMRLPHQPPETAAARIPLAALDVVEPIWQSSQGGLIFTLGHVGNNEAVAAGIAGRGWPIHVVADDTAYPELFEDFRRMRETWGVRIIPWRRLRELYGVLRRREMLGMLIDWGYRPDGIPVRLFDAWTTLPAGPAILAARTRSRILPITIHEGPGGDYVIGWTDPIDVASTEPAELARATQAMADALEAAIGAAPEQWYSFKPLWPETEAEQRELAVRAAAMRRGEAAAVDLDAGLSPVEPAP